MSNRTLNDIARQFAISVDLGNLTEKQAYEAIRATTLGMYATSRGWNPARAVMRAQFEATLARFRACPV